MTTTAAAYENSTVAVDADEAASAAERRDAFMERLLQSVIGAFDVYTLYIGERLGFYRALAEGGATAAGMTSAELAARTDTSERYAREWMEQQAVAGILTVEDPTAAPDERRFRLPAAHAEVLTERDSLNFMAPLARLFVGCARPIDAVLDAFRTGGGVRFEDYGEDLREGQGEFNRAAFLQQLGPEWLAAVPDVAERLRSDIPARVADVGCGTGYSSIGIARAFPNARIDGYDLDEASIDRAHANAREERLSDRVRFQCRDAGEADIAGSYDLAIALECVHDMSDPVAALRTMRRLTHPDGAVIVVDERVGDAFDPSAGAGSDNETERLMYGFSLLHCLPAGMACAPSACTGTVMRAGTMRAYALEAGFRDVEILPIDNYFFRFYRLHH